MNPKLCILSVLVLLGACKPEEPPRRAPPDEPAKAERALPKVEPTPELGKPLVGEPVSEPEPEQETAPAPEKEPEPVAVSPAGSKEPKPTTKKPVVKKTKTEPSIDETLPEVTLDLTLPEELAPSLEPAAQRDNPPPASVLPPMFNPPDSAFSLNGRIISQEREQDIDGAELRLEFKR
ncbi:hypothetical protein [Pseudomonas matsuisoli]|uniref:Translation initiation factor 2 n=1 Tax=Pseudomonas matsuisoli TaxID=1515666 RepID=A0A917PTL4_9PSED|nr:hypothetical protein [Pseudomonas matsuisoli]GGJ90471.1 hypothetical protein GCM10009304_15240 [Pseudomonas matsuisoli]